MLSTIKKVKDILSIYGCKEAYLFGSQVTGNINSFSDIDIGVRGLAAEFFFIVHAKLEDELQIPVDLVDFDVHTDFYKMLKSIGELKLID